MMSTRRAKALFMAGGMVTTYFGKAITNASRLWARCLQGC
ncbi:hypothetical protein BS78_08G148200 [Paspalum vaginatum]|nr:hypothetical protein BS78_08G148200 [Paspalum vaginatum]